MHGPPSSGSGGPEFDKRTFKHFLSAHFIKFEPHPARNHNKMDVIESKKAIAMLIANTSSRLRLLFYTLQ